MTFDKLIIENFGPYKGEQCLEFPSGDQNVAVVFGDNMRGKTSILNSLRWVLYGTAIDRAKNKIDLAKLLNNEAKERGITEIAVTLELTSAGNSYTIKRNATPLPGISVPKKESDFEIALSILKNGSVLPQGRLVHEINQILPLDVSRFSLFDGELLQEYEALLSDSKGQAKVIRESIERVLGVPSLIYGANELRTLEKDATREQAKANSHVESVRDQARHLESLTKEIRKLKDELDRLHGKKRTYQNHIAEAEEYLKTRAISMKLNSKKEGLERDLRKIKDERAMLRLKMKEALAAAWIDVLQPMISSHLDSLLIRQNDLNSKQREHGALQQQIVHLKELLQDRKCPVCKQTITVENPEYLATKCAKLEAKYDSLSESFEEIEDVGFRLKTLRGFSSTGKLKAAVDYESQLDVLNLNETRIEGELDELLGELKGFDPIEAAKQEGKKDEYTKYVGRLESDIERIEGELTKKEEQERKLSKLLSSNPQSRALRVNIMASTVTALRECFAGAINELRDALREKVSYNATSIFLDLTTESNYKALTINENYGLGILTKSDINVDLRSAGAEQIVALSLIAGLNSVSSMKLPMVMDTTFGRLDPRHRLNVLSRIPTMAPQVILLVHSGEVNPETGLNSISGKISSQYQIRRISEFYSVLDRRA